MGRALILETTFLIDLEREHLRGVSTGAADFLVKEATTRLYLPVIVAGELAAGASLANRAKWVARHLRGVGQLPGTNDLWTAATALANRMPVVTRNVEHFRRVPHLEVETY